MKKIFLVLLLSAFVFTLQACQGSSEITDVNEQHVAASRDHSMFLIDGEIYVMGQNTYSVLGIGTYDMDLVESTPRNITENFDLNDGETIERITAGLTHNIATTSEQRVFTWGAFHHGGEAPNEPVHTPQDITEHFNFEDGETIIKIVAHNHNFVLGDQGSLYAWGTNANYEIPYGNAYTDDLNHINQPVRLTDYFDALITDIGYNQAIDKNGGVYQWGETITNASISESSIDESDVIKITESLAFEDEELPKRFLNKQSALLTDQKRVLSTLNVLDDDHTRDFMVEEIMNEGAVMIDYVLHQRDPQTLFKAFVTNTEIYTWGHNQYGQLGTNDSQDREPITLFNDELDDSAQIDLPLANGETIISFDTFGRHNILKTSENRIFTWGYNENYQLGNGDHTNQDTPVEIFSE